MDIKNIPEQYLNDIQFVKTFISTMCQEISKKEEIFSDGENMMNAMKETLKKGLEQRKPLKPMIQMEREKKYLLEPILHSTNASENQLSTQLAIISSRLDENSLRDKTYLEKYNGIIETYRKTWLTRQSEYERIPAAVERHKKRIEFQLQDIKLALYKQKEKEYEKMIRNKENINVMRITTRIIKIAKMLPDRWEKQRTRENLTKNCVQLRRQLEAIAEERLQLLKLKEIEERSKLRARQLMPPPKLDLTFLKSFYTASRVNREREIERKRSMRFSSDSDDNVSITTEIIENMCNDDEEMTDMPRSISGIVMRQNNQGIDEENENTAGVEVLEKTYRQLSLEKDDYPPDSTRIEIPEVNGNSKRISPRKIESEGSPSAKKSRLEGIRELSEEDIQRNYSEELPENNTSVNKNRQLPQIRSIETISRSLPVAAKPLVAEICPRPSNLFSPHHYATSSFGSIDHFESAFNSQFDTFSEPETPLNTRVTNFTGQMDWGRFSPPSRTLQSEASFASNNSAFKNSDEPPQSHLQSNNGDSDFTCLFQAKTSKQTFFM